MLRGAHLVPRHHGPVRVAEQARVHPREVAEVGEVLHLAGRVAGPPVWARGEHRPGAVLQFGHLGQRPARLVQGHPDQPVPFLAVERRDLRLGRHPARVLELRDSDAPAVGPVPPAVVRADQLVAVDPAQRQRGTAVHAQVLAGPRLAAGAAPQHQWLAEQIGMGRLVGELGAERHRMPAVTQRAGVREGGRAGHADQGTAEACAVGCWVWCPWNRMDAIWVSVLMP